MTVIKTITSEEFKNIFSKVPRLTVEVLIKTKKGFILTLRCLPSWQNLWHIPGGTVLYGETLEQAVLRVAQEELNIQVKIRKFVHYIYYPSEEKERGYGWSVGMVFLCEMVSGDLKEDSQAKEIGFFKKLPTNMVAEQKEFIERYKKLI